MKRHEVFISDDRSSCSKLWKNNSKTWKISHPWSSLFILLSSSQLLQINVLRYFARIFQSSFLSVTWISEHSGVVGQSSVDQLLRRRHAAVDDHRAQAPRLGRPSAHLHSGLSPRHSHFQRAARSVVCPHSHPTDLLHPVGFFPSLFLRSSIP